MFLWNLYHPHFEIHSSSLSNCISCNAAALDNASQLEKQSEQEEGKMRNFLSLDYQTLWTAQLLCIHIPYHIVHAWCLHNVSN